MSPLIVTVIRQDGATLAEPLHAEFGAEGGTIGRAANSTLLLPDPERQISRTHARIEAGDDGYVLRDLGSAMPVLVNGRRLGNGHSAALRPGDEITIAGYVMRVDGNGFDPDATMIGSRPTAGPANPAADISMIGTVLSWAENGAAAPVDAIQTVIVPSPQDGARNPRPGDRPDDTPTDAPADASAFVIPPPTATSTSPPPGEPGAATGGPSGATPLAARPGSTTAGLAAAERPTTDTAPVPGADMLLQALLAGAGVPRLDVPGGLTPDFMRALGEMLREAVRGLLDLLHARALTKREVRADATVIVAQDNNPLKFSPTLEAALAHLLVPRGTGFMPAQRAVADAHASLHSHQVAFMAGMQAGLAAVLGRLDPHAIEASTGQPSLIGAFVPTARKARLWDQYAAVHAGVARDAVDDFQALFGREFLRAYQDVVQHQRVAERDHAAG